MEVHWSRCDGELFGKTTRPPCHNRVCTVNIADSYSQKFDEMVALTRCVVDTNKTVEAG